MALLPRIEGFNQNPRISRLRCDYVGCGKEFFRPTRERQHARDFCDRTCAARARHGMKTGPRQMLP